MRALGLDVGTKTVGIALSDELGWTAQGLETLRRDEDEPQKDMQKIADLIKEYGVEQVVVGLPKNMNGTIGPSGERSQEFAEQLKELVACEITLWDERLTTVAAEKCSFPLM